MNESRIASDILDSGHLSYPDGSYYLDSQSIVTPAYNVLLAFSASVVGVTPYDVAQVSIAIISMITVIGVYILALSITGSRKSAFAGSLVVALFGTFVYMTGSAWKESVGAALFVLLMLVYVRRSEPRMLVMEAMLLALLPCVHHLIAVIAYFSLVYLTGWSLLVAILNRSIKRRHIIDAMVMGTFSIIAYAYYRINSFEGLSYLDSENGLLLMVLSFLALFAVSAVVFLMKRHSKYSFAPIPAIATFILLVWNHYNPFFPYVQGETDYVLLLGCVTCLLIAVGWYGFEKVIEGSSRYRMVPLGLLLPVMTLFLFAFISGPDLSSHKILYRTYDIADISLALGISVGIAAMSRFPRRQMITVVAVLVALLISFPFAYASGTLIGIRHDTQEYEVDAIYWVHSHSDPSSIFQSDERLAYDARVLCDFEKNAGLPSVFAEERLPRENSFNAMLDQWVADGVNDYPYGYRYLNATFIDLMLTFSNVVYIGGPASNNIIIFYISSTNSDMIQLSVDLGNS